MANPELQEQESLDKKRDRIEGLKKSTNGEKDEATRGFDDLASELSRPKNNDRYTTEEIKTAATKRIDKMVQSKTGNLNLDEQKKLDDLKLKMTESLNASTNQLQMLQEYSKIRDKITGIVAAADGGKQQATENRKERLVEAENASKSQSQDAFDQFKKLLDDIMNRQNEARIKSQEMIQKFPPDGQPAGNQDKTASAREVLGGFTFV